MAYSEKRDHFYETVVMWVESLLVKAERRPVLIGINGPQGAGKSTLTAECVGRLASRNIKAVTISIDDFYLTRAKQVQLAARNADNPLLQQRGYPGTHDLELGRRVLGALKNLNAGGMVSFPVYDKSLHQGHGDRLPESEWKAVSGPLDVVFLEGWMLGFPKAEPASLPDLHFQKVNEFLEGYKAWTHQLDAFLQLRPSDPRYVLDWRVEAEERMKASGKPGMTTEEIRAYIGKFLKAYEIYLPLLAKRPPIKGVTWSIEIGRDRLPIG